MDVSSVFHPLNLETRVLGRGGTSDPVLYPFPEKQTDLWQHAQQQRERRSHTSQKEI